MCLSVKLSYIPHHRTDHDRTWRDDGPPRRGAAQILSEFRARRGYFANNLIKRKTDLSRNKHHQPRINYSATQDLLQRFRRKIRLTLLTSLSVYPIGRPIQRISIDDWTRVFIRFLTTLLLRFGCLSFGGSRALKVGFENLVTIRFRDCRQVN